MDYNARYHTRRAEVITQLGGACNQCGSVNNLEFDHIDPATKDFNVSKKITNADITDEISKLQLLCHRCHIEKSKLDNGVEHGGGLSGKRNCKCDPCKTRKNEYMRNWKQKRSLGLKS